MKPRIGEVQPISSNPQDDTLMGFVLFGSDGQPRAAFCYPDRAAAERAAKGFTAMLANCKRVC
jgi:hypothetical protein